jgi:hypothetical protein
MIFVSVSSLLCSVRDSFNFIYPALCFTVLTLDGEVCSVCYVPCFLLRIGKVKYFWYGRGGTLSRWLYFLVK